MDSKEVELEELKRNWNELGRRNPSWAALVDPTKKEGRWDLQEFFRVGEEDVARLITYIESLPLPTPPRKRALDFGCGIGRITQPLCSHFEQCVGVDIAPSMLRMAEDFNRHRGRCTYVLNDTEDFRIFEDGSFDFVFSHLVLQHITPGYTLNYIKEFVRMLAPGGLLIFQLPSEPAPFDPEEVLPDSALRAEIALKEPLNQVKAASQEMLRAVVKNLGNVAWPGLREHRIRHTLALGNHWLDADGNLLVPDDGRAILLHDLKPGEQVELALLVTVPCAAGTYIMELDMVQEMVTWFGDKGSATTRVEVRVVGDPSTKNHPAEEGSRCFEDASSVFVPKMEMHGIPKDVVLELIRREGGRILEVRDDYSAPGWTSFVYTATK